jgi:hypothetical protein
MIVVLPELHGSPRVLQLEPHEVIELARVLHDGPAEDQPPDDTDTCGFVPAWARLRRSVRDARHFADLRSALHFYRFGNHGLRAAAAARIVRRLRAAELVQGNAPV